MNWLEICSIPFAILICAAGVVFLISLGKAAKDADEAVYKALIAETNVTSGCPVDKEGG